MRAYSYRALEENHYNFLLKDFKGDLSPFVDKLFIDGLKDFADFKFLKLELIEKAYKENPDLQLTIVQKLINRFDSKCNHDLFCLISKTLVKIDHPKTISLLSDYLFGDGIHKDWAVKAIYDQSNNHDDFLEMVPKFLELNHKRMHEILVNILGNMKHENAGLILLEMVYNRDFTNLKGYLMRALRNYPNEKTITYLMNEARNSTENIQYWAIFCLGDMQIVKAVPFLIDLYKTIDNERIKETIIQSLLNISEISSDALQFLKENSLVKKDYREW